MLLHLGLPFPVECWGSDIRLHWIKEWIERNKKVEREIKEKRSSVLSCFEVYFCFYLGFKKEHAHMFLFPGENRKVTEGNICICSFFCSCYLPSDLMGLHLQWIVFCPFSNGWRLLFHRENEKNDLGLSLSCYVFCFPPPCLHDCGSFSLSLNFPSLTGSRKVVTFLDCLFLFKGGQCSL